MICWMKNKMLYKDLIVCKPVKTKKILTPAFSSAVSSAPNLNLLKLTCILIVCPCVDLDQQLWKAAAIVLRTSFIANFYDFVYKRVVWVCEKRVDKRLKRW